MFERSLVWNHATDLPRPIRQHQLQIAGCDANRAWDIREGPGIGHFVLGRESSPRETPNALDHGHRATDLRRSRRIERNGVDHTAQYVE